MDLLQLDNDRRYWVVRAGEGGTYFKHFEHNGVVAIGHMDDIGVTAGSINNEDIPNVEIALRKKETGKGKDAKNSGQISKAVSTIRSFVSNVRIGDVVITPKDNLLLIGKIASDPYIKHEPIQISRDGLVSSVKLPFSLRREVEWETIESKSQIPWPVNDSLRSSQTLFRLENELLEHWLYGMFIDSKGLHFSTRINRDEDISSFHTVEFQRNIQKLELIATLASEDRLDLGQDIGSLFKQIESTYQQMGFNNGFSLTTKQSFTSPGNIWSSIKGNLEDNSPDKRKIFMLALLVQLVFSTGNVEASDIEFGGLTDVDKKLLFEAAKIMKIEGHFNTHQKELKANLAKPKTSDKPVDKKKIPLNKPIIFPDVKEDGDTGK
jgi:hypothetical protein